MIFSSFFEKALTGRDATRRRKEIDSTISEERANLDSKQQELVESVRVHEAISSSATRVMNTMTHAMIMMEAKRGKPRK